MENQYLTYKGRSLVRCGDEIYYGNITDKYIILIRETATKKVGDVDIGTKFDIELQLTDPDIKGKGKIRQTAQKASFTDALEIAEAWLNRFNV
ncbi:MAG: hypothetical protein II828_00390 [Clostridia bacterium]|nr:hypothetical protein [Clostridia bacterium]